MQPLTEILRRRAQTHLEESAAVKRQAATNCLEALLAASELVAQSLQSGGKILLCGNGGSAADSQHLAAEFVSRLSMAFQRRALAALALTTDSSILTAIANDDHFDCIFQRQVEALGRPGDVLIGISTSGNSANVLRAMEAAKKTGLRSIVLMGRSGRLANLADVVVAVPADKTQYIQETHLALEHLLCDLVEYHLFPEKQRSAEERP